MRVYSGEWWTPNDKDLKLCARMTYANIDFSVI